jgi:hypothetical protein
MKISTHKVQPLQSNGRFFRRRAVELYDQNSPFKGRSERNRKIYTRKIKHDHRTNFD